MFGSLSNFIISEENYFVLESEKQIIELLLLMKYY